MIRQSFQAASSLVLTVSGKAIHGGAAPEYNQGKRLTGWCANGVMAIVATWRPRKSLDTARARSFPGIRARRAIGEAPVGWRGWRSSALAL
jgi:hypothetical protein